MTKSRVLLMVAFVALGAVAFTGCASWQTTDDGSARSYPPPSYGGGGHHH